MTNAPVYYVLAQVRFNTVLALDTYLPAIQENFRRSKYPDFEKSIFPRLNINTNATQGQALPLMQTEASYTFKNERGVCSFILDQNRLTIQTTEYDTFGPFLAEFLTGLKIVNDTVELSYSERAGVRFLDAVIPKKGEKLSAYLTSASLGVFEQLADRELVHCLAETRTKLGKTVLMSRAAVINQEAEGEVAFPPELGAPALVLAEKFRKVKGVYGVIDTDSWVEEREKFDLSTIEKRLISLHDEIGRSFRLMVTPDALNAWK